MRARPASLPIARYAVARYAVPIATAAIATALVVQTYWYERNFVSGDFEWKSIALVAACAVFLASAFTLASRRLLASIALSCTVLVVLTTISVAKFEYLRASLYALDFYYYTRPTELVFLYEHYPRTFLQGLCGIVLAGVAMVALFRADESRVSRSRALGAFGLAALVLAGAYHWRGQRDKIYHFVGWYHVSAAVASAPEAVGILLRGGFLKAEDEHGTIDSKPVAGLQNAIPGQKPPTIVSILHESSFPIDIFPIQCGGPKPSALYTSSNGGRYDLRVETYGGGTWITEYGMMLGLSTYYFGDARSFVGYAMENRIHDSLPLQLRRHGYESVALYPSPKSFVNSGRFYPSIGFDKLYDYYDLKATTERERDRFFYGKALDQIRAHKASGSTKPLFLSVWTMASHGPFDEVLYPEVPPDRDAICATDTSWSEYIRRLLMAEADLAWFQDTLKSEFPDEPFMLVGFGDHQPFLTQDLLNTQTRDPRDPAKNSIAYKTFFRITGVNFEPDLSLVPKSLDVPFLGNATMIAARLPRHGFYNDRDKLMLLCKGRYNDCPRQDEVLSFHDRMIKASTIENY